MSLFSSKRKTIVTIAVIILVLGGATGTYFWKQQSDANKTEQAINSFATCVAAGNPIMESYPEQCAANGKTYANPNQKINDDGTATDTSVKPTDETASWLLYTSADNTYSVRIPDGWDMVTLASTENLYGGRTKALTYAQGTKAIVTTTEGGWDGASPFALYVPGSYYDQIVKEGTKQGEITTNAGITAEKYLYIQTTEPEAIGYEKDSKVYNYYFGTAGKYIQIQHVVAPGQTDQSTRVEQMLKTLVIN